MKRNIIKLILTYLLISGLVISLSHLNIIKADNGTAYKTYTIDSSGKLAPTQDAYLAAKNITSINLTNSTNYNLASPSDIYYNEVLDKFYIADTKNSRVIVASHDLASGYIIGDSILKEPKGVFATNDGTIYVADYALQAVAIFKADDLENPTLITKPNHPIYLESSNTFAPAKIVVDPVGTMYIIDEGNPNGIVTITKDGEFRGYFGANYTKPSLSYTIRFLLSSKEQKKKMYVSPVSPTNLAIDNDGLINTISNTLGSAVKKLNIAGTNLFPTDMYDWTDYLDIAISPTGTILCIEKYGYITEYDQEGNLLFDFGGYDTTGTYRGLFKSPTSIEVDNDYSLYVLDENRIQVFYQTEFASLVHEALKLYNDGKYQESRNPWQKVLQLNNMFDLAHRGLGNAYLREGNYQKALAEFKLAKDTKSYSDAYWEVRNNWINNYGYFIILGVLGFVLIFIILNKLHLLDKPKQFFKNIKAKVFKIKFFREVFYLFKFIRKPLDGFYEIRHQSKMGLLAATFWYVWYFLIMVFKAYATGFVFNPVDKETISIISILTQSIVPLLLFVIANYLISSITNGSGRLRDVYVGTICSMAPVLIFMPIVTILSNFIVQSEAFFYTMPSAALLWWSFALMYFMIKDLQELGIGENNKNIVLTILTMLLFIAFAFLLYILSKQLVTFITDIIREVSSRV